MNGRHSRHSKKAGYPARLHLPVPLKIGREVVYFLEKSSGGTSYVSSSY